jgi:hypothetical protein
LTVNKACDPLADPGLFNLRIDGTTHGADEPCGGTTGEVEVSIGSHTVSETAGTGTNLANYVTVIGGDCAADGSVILAAGETKTCTITNTRKPTLTVNKACDPLADPGLFNLRIDGTTYGGDKPCGGTTGPVVVSVGPHTVSETAGSGTNLVNYLTVIGGDCAADGSVTLAAGENKTCTITNTRKGRIIIRKDAVDGANQNPTQDFSYNCTLLGGFELDDDGASGNPLDDVTTFDPVSPGDYGCTENQVSGWMMEISCTDPDGGTTITPPTANIDVDPGETVDCTFTNSFVGGGTVVGGIAGLIDGGDAQPLVAAAADPGSTSRTLESGLMALGALSALAAAALAYRRVRWRRGCG